MAIKVGINGLGRIGRMVVRAIIESNNKNIEIKHINNRADSETSCLLLMRMIQLRLNERDYLKIDELSCSSN